ncbi:MAG TPA: hypothetical protein HPP66_01615 [Planctomycetes bacterium]|nr:hypothetical protein [Planctomycetota bacterium]
MNTFWLKIAGIVIVVLVAIIVINVVSNSEPEPRPPQKTFRDQIEEDDRRLRADPQFKQPPQTTTPVQPGNQTRTVGPPKTGEPTKPKFRQLSEIENIDAEQLFNNAIQFRKIGRLPGPRYRVMVDACRQIIQRYPGSEWAWKAKRMLGDIPEHYRSRYHITKEEIDLGDFK